METAEKMLKQFINDELSKETQDLAQKLIYDALYQKVSGLLHSTKKKRML